MPCSIGFDVLARNRAADDLVLELEARCPRSSGSSSTTDVAVLAPATGLAHEAPLGADRLA